MNANPNDKKYSITERRYKNIKVREFKPIRTAEEEKEHSEYVTRICAQIIRNMKKSESKQ